MFLYRCRIRKLKGYQEGSFTVELSMLFPIIILVIAAIMVFTLYMNDMVCIRTSVNRYILNVAEQDKTDREIEALLQEKLKNQTLILNVKNVESDELKHKKRISVNVDFKFNFLNIDKRAAITVTTNTGDITSFLRNAKVFMDITENLKGE